jgi:hypothetical protein
MSASVSDRLAAGAKSLEDAEDSVYRALHALDGVSEKLYDECVSVHVQLSSALDRVTRARNAVDGVL